MLRVYLHYSSTLTNLALWRYEHSSWTAPHGSVTPFLHSSLDHYCIADDTRVLFAVRERCCGLYLPAHESRHTPNNYHQASVSPAGYDEFVSQLDSWPLACQTLEILQDGPAPLVRLWRNHWATTPIYVFATENSVRVDWNLANFYPILEPPILHLPATVAFLVGQDVYSWHTIFQNLYALTERATITCRSGCPPQVLYPCAGRRLRAQPLVKGADVVATYNEILAASIMRSWPEGKGSPLGLEVSGGLDSANVGLGAARVHPQDLFSYGIILRASAGLQQSGRRRELIHALDLNDSTVLAHDFPPLDPNGMRLCRPVNPFDEPYYEALRALLQEVKEDGLTSVLTGIGGDELHALTPEEQNGELARSEALGVLARRVIPEYLTSEARDALFDAANLGADTPRTLLPASALDAAVCRAPTFLRAGIWPAHPLMAPELQFFCQRLPVGWRTEKNLHRENLRRAGLSESFLRPQLQENFRPVMFSALTQSSRSLLWSLFSDSYLESVGIVDGDALARSYRAYLELDDVDEVEQFYELAVLELALRSIDQR